MKKMILETMKKLFVFSFLLFAKSRFAFAEATSQQDLVSFLENIGDFLIKSIAIPLIILSLVMAGVSIAVGSRDGQIKAFSVGIGGAVILLAKAFVDWIANAAGF